MAINPDDDHLTCQFCDDIGFDASGLKTHIKMGYCEAFEAIERCPTIYEDIAKRISERSPRPETPAERGG